MQSTKEWLDSKNINYIKSADGFLSVGGYLDLEGAVMPALPDILSVDDSPCLRGTGIEQPKSIKRPADE